MWKAIKSVLGVIVGSIAASVPVFLPVTWLGARLAQGK